MKIALFVDGDNISPKYMPAIMSEIQKRGTLAIKRIYGDWTNTGMHGWQDCLKQFCIRPIQQFRYGENATDGAIIMDAMEVLLTTDRIDCFCIVSSDSDFYSLCLRIREHGKTVIGIGNKKTKDVLIRACDEFVRLENLSLKEQKSTKNRDEEPSDPETLLVRAYTECSGDEEWVSFANLGSIARMIDPSFDPRTYNHFNFRSLLKSLDIFEIRKDQCLPPNYFCRLKEKPESETIKKQEGVIKNMLSWYGFIQGHDGDYYFTLSNISGDQKNLRIQKGMKVLFGVIKPPDPAAADTSEKNGKAGNVEFIDAGRQNGAPAG
jgi:hypothetical protein